MGCGGTGVPDRGSGTGFGRIGCLLFNWIVVMRDGALIDWEQAIWREDG